jgi:cytoskeletal protein RodZ
MPLAGNNQEERMATKSTSTKKAAPEKKAKSAASQAPKGAKAVRKPGGPADRLPLVKVTVTYQVGDNTTAEFTIDSAKLRDVEFQRKLEKFIAEASDSKVYVAANGEWKPSADK